MGQIPNGTNPQWNKALMGKFSMGQIPNEQIPNETNPLGQILVSIKYPQDKMISTQWDRDFAVRSAMRF